MGARRGTYRIIYQIDENSRILHVLDIDHRSETYRRSQRSPSILGLPELDHAQYVPKSAGSAASPCALAQVSYPAAGRWQSGLIIRRAWVRVPPAPPAVSRTGYGMSGRVGLFVIRWPIALVVVA
jgi:ParE toxin of type II toxin-antitoxin system, parDE